MLKMRWKDPWYRITCHLPYPPVTTIHPHSPTVRREYRLQLLGTSMAMVSTSLPCLLPGTHHRDRFRHKECHIRVKGHSLSSLLLFRNHSNLAVHIWGSRCSLRQSCHHPRRNLMDISPKDPKPLCNPVPHPCGVPTRALRRTPLKNVLLLQQLLSQLKDHRDAHNHR